MRVRASRLVSSVFALAAALSVAGPADAQRIVTYGDSLSDNGNLPVGLAPPPPYNGGRFTNGITWTEILSGGSQGKPLSTFTTTGNVNLALGGARSDSAANLLGPIPGVPAQIQTFQVLGGTYGAKDLVTIQGGANNIFQYFTTAGAGANQAGITSTSIDAANALSASVQTLTSNGARRILVGNLPDLGSAPQFNTTASGQQGGSLATQVFNTQLDANIRALAAANPQVNYIQMDWAGLFRAVINNAAAFGYTNTTQACTAVISCVTGSAAVQNRFVFWDAVHPTATGHQILAQYASLLLAPEATTARIAPLSDVAIRSRQDAADDVFDRASGWARGQFSRQNGAYVKATGSYADVDARGGTPAYRTQLGGLRAGLDRANGNVLLGGSVGISTGEIGGSSLNADVNAYDIDVYATWLNGPLFVTGQGGASAVTFDTSRHVGLGPITATGSTTSWQGSAALEAGVIARFGALTVVPSGRINYIHANVRGFDERADILAMSFRDRTVDAFFASGRVRASTPVALGLGDSNAFAEVGYEGLLSSSGNTVSASFVNNTAFPFSTAVGNPLARGFNAKVGVDGRIGEQTSIAVTYGIALQDGVGIAHLGNAQIKVPF